MALRWGSVPSLFFELIIKRHSLTVLGSLVWRNGEFL